MSKFLNIFNSKNKNNKKLVKSSTVGEIMVNQKNDEDSPPVLSRKMSLTKSGRMKEKKRKNVSVSDYFPQGGSPEIKENEKDCDNEDVFTVEEVIREMHQIGRTEITTM